MTREVIAKKIRWSRIIWTFGLINVIAMMPQLWQIVVTRKTDDLNLGMIWIYFAVQVAFSLQGFFRRDKMLMWCLGLSAIISMIIILITLHLRHA
jgi:uncharacterized protein with PQ loop repeat